MTETAISDGYDTPTALCGLCGESMVFIGRSHFGAPLFFCDKQQEGQRMPDDGYAWRNLLRRRISEQAN